MPLCTVEYVSVSLDSRQYMNVLVPPGSGPFPVLMLLHGLTDNYSTWVRRTSIPRLAESRRLIIVMPDAFRSFYVNDARPGGHRYEDHLIRDVLGTVERMFPAIGRRQARAVAGLSMGGYGALMLALRYPETFAAASSHSGALSFVHGDLLADYPDVAVLARALPRPSYDLFTLAAKLKAHQRPALRLDCGTEDFLLPASRAFHAHLNELDFKHHYEEYPGTHNWDYWDAHIAKTLDFAEQHLATK